MLSLMPLLIKNIEEKIIMSHYEARSTKQLQCLCQHLRLLGSTSTEIPASECDAMETIRSAFAVIGRPSSHEVDRVDPAEEEVQLDGSGGSGRPLPDGQPRFSYIYLYKSWYCSNLSHLINIYICIWLILHY